MRAIHALAAAILLGLTTGEAASLEAGKIVTFEGACEPSAVVSFPEGTVDRWFIVADDNDNRLRVYEATTGRHAEKSDLDLNDLLGLDASEENDKIDLEGGTRLGNSIYFVGSHSRSGRKGKIRPSRSNLFAITAYVDGGVVRLLPQPSSYRNLRNDLSGLSDALMDAIGVAEEDESLAPGAMGLNIEGMSVTADGTGLLLGFRNPLIGKKAPVVLFVNPQAVLSAGARPNLQMLPPVDLLGNGIRSIEYVPAKNGYLLLSGPSDDGEGFTAWWWSLAENSVEPIEEINSFLDDNKDFRAEAIVADDAGAKISIFSDNDDACDDGARRFTGVTFR